MEAGEAMEQSPPATASVPFKLEGAERLVVRSDPTIKSYIPFGFEGTSVIISPYGEILRMSQYVVEEDPRIICLASPSLVDYQRDLRGVGIVLHRQAQIPGTGFGIHLESASEAKKPSFETRLEWLNGHWPCIYYELNGLAVSVAFTMERGVLSQQYVIVNPSETNIDILFDLRVGHCEVYTLYVNGTRWAGHRDSELSNEEPLILPDTSGAFHIAERNLRNARELSPQTDNHGRSVVRGEAVIAIFQNGTLVIPEDTFPISIPHRNFSDNDEDSDNESEHGGKPPLYRPKLLQIKPKGTEKLVVQYKLQSQGIEDSRVVEYLDADTILKGDRSGNWSFKQNDIFNPIFRRHLEHILCVCLVNVLPTLDQQRRFAFINDFTFEWGSAPVNDFYIFRYLLFMYKILETDEHIKPTPDSSDHDTNGSNFQKCILQNRIREACEGHLLWCFEKDVLLAGQSWPLSKLEDDTDSSDNKSSTQPFIGSLQMLKLFEYSRIFQNEALIVDQCLRGGAESWLDALTKNRDKKSELWYEDTKQAHVAWEGHRGERSEWLRLPEYRLRDLICIWKALKCLEEMMRNSDERFTSEILKRLNESKLRHHDVRKIILHHFLCEDLEAGAPRIADRSASNDHDNSSERAEPTTGSFAIAVRRTRESDRLLFYTKDSMLHDGFEWGFFENDLEIEVLNTKKELIKADVQISWKNTIGAQGGDREAIWEKPLKYALAITMARYGSLDRSMSPETLEKLSWERLFDCVTPCGLFVDSIERDTKRSEMMFFDCSQRSLWEIPTLLLRKRVESLELVLDPPQLSASNEQESPQTSDSTVSQDANNAMKKSVYLEKQRMRSHIKPDMRMVSDPTERKLKDWLYPYPDFFSSQSPYGPMQEEVKRLEHRLSLDTNDRTDDGFREDLAIVLKRGVERWKVFKEWGGREAFSTYTYSAILVNIGQHRRNEPSIIWCDADELDSQLRKARIVEKAKKRFLYLGPLQVEQALILYLATPIYDRQNMEQFCIRHTNFSSHFHEDVHPLADVWASELHLSFLQLVDIQERARNQYYHDSDNVCNGRQRKFPHIVKDSQFDIYKASLGYRFLGDMGDRFWTGWLLAYFPGESRTLGYANGENNVWQWFGEKTKNDQRRILEPFLVGSMVAEVYQSTDKILRHVDQWLDPEIEFPKENEGTKESDISTADDQDFGLQYNRSTTCLELEAILSMLRRLSKANVDSLYHWSEREKSRHYKPRWSEKDELNHREQVDHQKRRAEQQIFLLNDQHRQIETSIDQLRAHRQELMDNLNLTQSRTAALNAENVRIFTYATVIFYPLSFVASLFSMQGPPNHSTTAVFIQATAIALVITLVIVFNAEILAWPFRRLRFSISLTAREKMGETSNVFPVSWKKTLRRIKEAEEQDVLHDIEMPKWPRSKLIYLMFLMIYLVVEFPASRIVLAYESVVRKGARSPENIALTAIQILIALVMLPVFLIVWMILTIWSILRSALSKVWAIQEFQGKIGEELLDAAVKEYVEAEEKNKEQDGEKEIDRKGAPVTTHEERGDKKKEREPKEPLNERKKELKKKVEEARRIAGKGREDRLHEHVKLLINPPKLYEAKVKGVKAKTKSGEDQKMAAPRTSTATSSWDKDEANVATNKQSLSLEDQSMTSRSLWRLARRLKKKAIDEEVKVAGRDGQTNTAEHT